VHGEGGHPVASGQCAAGRPDGGIGSSGGNVGGGGRGGGCSSPSSYERPSTPGGAEDALAARESVPSDEWAGSEVVAPPGRPSGASHAAVAGSDYPLELAHRPSSIALSSSNLSAVSGTQCSESSSHGSLNGSSGWEAGLSGALRPAEATPSNSSQDASYPHAPAAAVGAVPRGATQAAWEAAATLMHAREGTSPRSATSVAGDVERPSGLPLEDVAMQREKNAAGAGGVD